MLQLLAKCELYINCFPSLMSSLPSSLFACTILACVWYKAHYFPNQHKHGRLSMFLISGVQIENHKLKVINNFRKIENNQLPSLPSEQEMSRSYSDFVTHFALICFQFAYLHGLLGKSTCTLQCVRASRSLAFTIYSAHNSQSHLHVRWKFVRGNAMHHFKHKIFPKPIYAWCRGMVRKIYRRTRWNSLQ